MDNANPLSLAFLQQKPAAAAVILQEFSAEQLAEFLPEVPLEILVPVIASMAAWPAARALAQVPPNLTAAVLRNLPDSEAETLLRLMGNDYFQAIIEQMPAAVAKKFYRKLAYPLSTVGAWMDTSIPSFTGDSSVEHCLEQVRLHKTHLGGIVIVINDKRALIGIVNIEKLLTSSKNASLQQLMDGNVNALSSRATLWEVEHHEGWNHFPTLPVVDLEGHVLGALTHSALRTGTARAVYRQQTSRFSLLTHMTRSYFAALGGMLQLVAGVQPGPAEAPYQHSSSDPQDAQESRYE